MKLKVDLHIHTCYSQDSDLKPEDLIRTAREHGLDVIGITDHNTTEGWKPVLQARDRIYPELPILLGEEIKTKEGEVIGLCIKKFIKPGQGLVETCKEIKTQNGFIILPHPFDLRRKSVGEKARKIVKYVDAVEIFNSRCLLEKFNQKAEMFANKHGLPKTVGSDAHSAGEIGKTYILVDSEKNKVLEAIKEGKAKMSTRRIAFKSLFKAFLKKIFISVFAKY